MLSMSDVYNQLRAAVFQEDQEVEKKKVGGIGLILDTRLKQAQNNARHLKEQLRAISFEEDTSQEMVEIGSGGLKSEYQTLKEQVARAQAEESAARDDDAIVIDRMHVQGPAYHSGALAIGDRILEVDATVLGTDLALAGRLIRGQVGTEVQLRFRRSEGGAEGEVSLERALIPDHAAQYDDDENSEPSHAQPP